MEYLSTEHVKSYGRAGPSVVSLYFRLNTILSSTISQSTCSPSTISHSTCSLSTLSHSTCSSSTLLHSTCSPKQTFYYR